MTRVKRAAFIIPYFGKLPNYFPAWLISAAYNIEYDFFLFTDDETSYPYPDNVICKIIGFDDFVEMVKNRFDFPISITNVSKLCDFKPTWGYVFENELKNYQWWGYCDIDIILGNLDKTLTTLLTRTEYNKLFCHGHMTLYRNTRDVNRLFLNDIAGYTTVKEILNNDIIYVFDEHSDDLNVNLIFKTFDKGYWFDYEFSDIDPFKFRMVRGLYDYEPPYTKGRILKKDPIQHQIYVWERGNLYLCGLDEGHITFIDRRYMHLQKRPMKFCMKNSTSIERFVIVPNEIKAYSEEIDEKFIRRNSLKYIPYLQYFKIRSRSLIKRLRDFIQRETI